MTDIQETVATIADELVGSGAERGLQVAAYVDQQPVVDVAAGVADPGTGRPVRPGTLFYNWSIGKGVFGMAGAAGSWAGADPDRGVAVAVTRNVMGMDFATVERVVRAILDAVDRG